MKKVITGDSFMKMEDLMRRSKGNLGQRVYTVKKNMLVRSMGKELYSYSNVKIQPETVFYYRQCYSPPINISIYGGAQIMMKQK